MSSTIDRWPAIDPQPDDRFTRLQIIQFLEEIPLGYRTEAEHGALERFVDVAQRQFARLSTDFEPPND
jgi:hypothetical protein